MNLETYTLPEHWAPALINDDRTGMSDDDEAALDKWFAATFPHGAHCIDVTDDEHSPGFTRYHDAHAFVAACNCAVFTFDVPEITIASEELFVPGERVAYRASFLRAIGDYSHAQAARRGAVTGLTVGPLVQVRWDDAAEPAMVNRANLIRADRIHLEPA